MAVRVVGAPAWVVVWPGLGRRRRRGPGPAATGSTVRRCRRSVSRWRRAGAPGGATVIVDRVASSASNLQRTTFPRTARHDYGAGTYVDSPLPGPSGEFAVPSGPANQAGPARRLSDVTSNVTPTARGTIASTEATNATLAAALANRDTVFRKIIVARGQLGQAESPCIDTTPRRSPRPLRTRHRGDRLCAGGRRVHRARPRDPIWAEHGARLPTDPATQRRRRRSSRSSATRMSGGCTPGRRRAQVHPAADPRGAIAEDVTRGDLLCIWEEVRCLLPICSHL